MQKPRRLVGVAVAAALLATTFGLAAPAAGQTTGGAAASAADYPFPLPDFSHPDSPHAPQFKKHQLPPMLVVSGQFDDLTDLSESGTEDKFFPFFTFGTVSDYYLQNGLGVLVPVPETYGERDNGIVLVELGNSAGWFSQDVGVRRRTMLDLADPYVDFARFDTNNNGRIENSELVVVTLVTSPDPTYSCGQTAAVGPGRALDGKTIAFTTADGGSLTNNLTFAHEVAHQNFDLADHYGFGVGAWDLAGPTCAGPNNQIWQAPNAWHRMHIGDDKPTVITKDRYVTLLPNDMAPYGSYLLYDPERGTDDYFMIEARRPVAGKYDQNVPDDGLMVWRVDERNVRSGLEHVRGVEMIRPDGMRTPGCVDQDVDGRTDEDPVNNLDDDGDGLVDEDPQTDGACYSGSDTDAWNAFDARTPQREMTAPWADGTPAKVAVRAIGHTFAVPARAMVRAFIDVRGPGVLVDAAEPNGDSPHPTLTAGSTTTFSFAVMNTGEATDTFEFTELVPDGWTATTQRMTLTAGQRATATITVTAGTDELVGERHTLIARGRSTTDSSVVTEYPFLVDMNRPSAITYTGDSTVDHSDPARLAARVTDKFSGAPLAGHKVVFSHADWLTEATTGADGLATASWPADLAPGAYTFTMSAGSKNGYTASSSTFPITVEAESATLAITSPTMYADDSGQAMTVKVTEEADGSPADLGRATVQVQLRSALTGEVRNYSATADTNGIATVGVDAPAGLWSATAGLTGGYFTAPPIQAELVVFNPDGEVTGAAVAPDGSGRNVVLTVAARYADNAPTGAVTMTANRQTFNGTALRWLVVSGTSAVFEIGGTLNNQPATLRATVHTDGDRDRFSVKVTSATATYTSGDLTARTGALTVRTS
ncbi:COG1470 family protein [Kribbella sp. CA-294648]|uniref:COG1470 family protein n=1 Tax=Kribbella sp. CA-294648 TaxID=3239948 RepID=UPI003D8FC6C1